MCSELPLGLSADFPLQRWLRNAEAKVSGVWIDVEGIDGAACLRARLCGAPSLALAAACCAQSCGLCICMHNPEPTTNMYQ